jgi:hypothetical protein
MGDAHRSGISPRQGFGIGGFSVSAMGFRPP